MSPVRYILKNPYPEDEIYNTWITAEKHIEVFEKELKKREMEQ